LLEIQLKKRKVDSTSNTGSQNASKSISVYRHVDSLGEARIFSLLSEPIPVEMVNPNKAAYKNRAATG